MKTLSIDIETYSDVPLQKSGVHRYCESPNFEILLFGYSADSGPVQVVDLACGEKIPKGAEGGTHLRNVILALQSPTDKAAACMESLGVEVYDSEGNMRSLNDILGDLNTSMDGMTSAEKQNIISSIFNKTDLAAVNSLLVNTGDSWDSLQQSITESGGAAQQMADTQLDNLSGQITILKSALEGLAISFGEILMPKIRAAAKKIQEFVDKLNGMNDEQKETVVKIAAVGADEEHLTVLDVADLLVINPEKVGCMVGTMLGVFATGNGETVENSASFDYFLHQQN